MSEKPFYENPFETSSPAIDGEVSRLQGLHTKRVAESSTFQEGVLILISKLIEMTKLSSKCFVTEDRYLMDQCSELAKEVHEEEKILTSYLLSRGVPGETFEGVIRFPYRLERIGDMLENILHCCRVKVDRELPLSDTAKDEVKKLLLLVEEMLTNLRDAFQSLDRELLEAMLNNGKTLSRMIEDFTSAHWKRLEEGTIPHESSSMYREILDSVKWTNDYLEKMWISLLKTSELIHGSKEPARHEQSQTEIAEHRA
jgi:Na+/phosphate symporter